MPFSEIPCFLYVGLKPLNYSVQISPPLMAGIFEKSSERTLVLPLSTEKF
jgi:hypothetical protein